jgi:hypothetical protein
MKTIQATGRCYHHYWLDYVATIGLTFPTMEDAAAALPLLAIENPGPYRDACGNLRQCSGWITAKDRPALAIRCAGETLEKVIDRLVELGADRKKITSCAHSIDSGEAFTATFQVAAAAKAA